MAAKPLSAKTYLVAVGIADYPGTKNDLRLCAKDAGDVAQLYKLNKNSQTILLTNQDATTANILKAMRTLYANATDKDDVVFFFSGHGVKKGAFVAYDGLLPYKHIREAMAQGKAKCKMILADACFAGMFREDKKQKYNQNDDKKSDVVLFLSSRTNEVSREQRMASNGLFTKYLLSGLRGRADVNDDRTITAKELFNYVSSHVVAESKKKQHPVMWGRFKDNLPIFTW